MDDKTLQALTALAEKLGTTAEYLWGVLIRQAPISGTVDLLLMLGLVAGVVVWAAVVYRCTKVDKNDPCAEAIWDVEMTWVPAWGSVVLLAMVAALMVGNSLPDIVAAFLNPEYWALRQIMRAG